MALERDERRYEVLSRRVALAGAADHVNCVHTDFFDLNSQDRDAAEAILLDPSCSSSGVVTRVDISVNENNNNKRSRDNKNENEDTSFKKSRPVVEETPEEKLLKLQTEHNVTLWEGASTAALSLEDMLLQQEKELKKVQHQFEKESKTNNNNNNENDEIEKIIEVENANPEEEYTPTDDMERVLKLAHLQKKLLTHALLSFENCRTVVYSTCSIHEEEDELVVLQVLMDERVRERGWQLSHILPKSWESRGREAAYLTEHKSEEVEKIKSDLLSSCENNDTNKEEEVKKRKKWFKESLESLKKTIRCDPAKDKTNGFYVARFDRELPSS
ncbi:hypothetical protein AGDE_11795 [Angomonas deanei]|uniref:16S rRNA methyltransferase RsmB/F, putative n=1 Tax=Angomonas deanei TaxID=59799 RepID=A0A7G2CIR3_9TRYP|nr:hypothetical protein AGDE_11795 [Angomonas deanei]CAD2218841.1 16S rRNA methyltransferase RsmB/F, putative [Angomonas deanei]|eukprot:EPY25412.1 hypothetical protein AGDE_11795 [Angomonas deanei]